MRKAIAGFEGMYEISTSGEVFSLDRRVSGKHGTQRVTGRKLKIITHKQHGYSVVNLSNNGKLVQKRVHILVAQAFIENPENKLTVNHKNGIKSDNHVSNLEWATHEEQFIHAVKNNLMPAGERNGGNKVKDIQYIEAFHRCMAGEEVNTIAQEYGISRNTVTRGFYRMGFKEIWQEEARNRKRTASLKRWNKY